MNEAIRKQILAVKETGEVNLFDRYGVQALANEMNFYDLVVFIEEEPKAYQHFILTGEVLED